MYNLLPLFMVILLPFMFMSNPSLIFLWAILEMSSIMFICMSLSEEEMKKKESFLMYFLIQSFASAFLLTCLFSWSTLNKTMVLENPNNLSMMISVLISLKIAMAPLHFWLVKMSKMVSWFVLGTLLTWQKMIPLSFFSSFSMNFFISSICIISLIMGTLSQLKLTSLKMLIVFSSISHLGWMMFPLIKYSIMILIYLTVYSMIILPMISMMFYSNYLHLFNQINVKMVTCLCLLILSLSGIPPLMGFLLKWMSLNFMVPSVMTMMLFSLMACLSFYIYIRIIYKGFLLSPFSFKETTMTMNMKWVWSLNFFLPIIPEYSKLNL